MNAVSNHARTLDIMRQGFAKRAIRKVIDPRKARLREIDDALAGRRGYQSEWALNLLREERDALTSR